MHNPCIYKITSPTNKIYIGQTTNFTRRMNSYKNFKKIKHQKKLINSLGKYGFENHRIDILINCKKEELNFWEEFYIKIFNSYDGQFALNSTSGGDSPKNKLSQPLTNEWKEKISKAHLGKKREKFSQEWIENISKSHKKVIKSEEWLNNLKKSAILRKTNGGYKFSKEQIEKSRKALINFYKTEKGKEIRKNISNRTKVVFSKPILQYTIDGQFVMEYSSIREAARTLNVAHPQITNCANGKAKTASGYIWKKKQQQTTQ